MISGDPVISPDGTKVAYSATVQFEGTTEIHLADLTAGTVTARSVNSHSQFLSLSNTELALASGVALAPDDTNGELDVYTTPIGYSSTIEGQQGWGDTTDWADVSFEGLARDVSCDPGPGLSSPTAVDGVTITSGDCFGTHFDAATGDNALELPVGGRITFPAGVTDVTILTERVGPLGLGLSGHYSFTVHDGSDETRTVLGTKSFLGYDPMTIHSAEGIEWIEVNTSSNEGEPRPLRISHLLVAPSASLSAPPPPLNSYGNAAAFDAEYPGADPISLAGLPKSAVDYCWSSELDPPLPNPMAWEGLMISSPYCFRTESGYIMGERGTIIDLPARTAAVSFTSNAPSKPVIVQAQQVDGGTITTVSPTAEDVFFGFGSDAGIARLRLLGGTDLSPVIVRNLKIAALPPPSPESESNLDVDPGGQVSTGSDATPTDPVETTIDLPGGLGGEVSISETSDGDPVDGFAILGQQIEITAPDATLESPLTFTFVIDSSVIPAGYTKDSIEILRNGTPAAECSGAVQIPDAPSDPCVTSREELPDGDMRFVILSSHASTWIAAVADNEPPTALMQPFSPSLQVVTKLKPIWQGVDPEGTPITFTAQRRETKRNGDTGAWSQISQGAATTKSVSATAGSTYCFRVRAQDSSGNMSAFSEPVCGATPADDRALSVTAGPWTRKTPSGAYRGTTTEVSSKGATLRLKNVEALELSLLATRCGTCGKVTALWNGQAIKTVDTKGSSKTKVLYPLETFEGLETGTLVLKTGSNAKVIVDGVGIERS